LSSEGCQLAISYHHVEEIAQLGSEKTRTRRLMTLWEFRRGSVRYSGLGSGSVLEAEIENQLCRLTGAGRRPSSPDGLQGHLFPPSTPERIASDVSATLAGLRRNREFRQLSAWSSTQWKALREHARERGVKFPISEESPLSPEAAELFAENVSKLRIPAELDLVPDIVERVHRAARGRYSQRRATEHLFALENTRAARMAPKIDLPELSIFMHFARRVAAEIDAKRSPNSRPVTPLVADLNPYACPGFRLRLARLRAQVSSRTPDAPGDLVDADHLLYAPYVEVMFVDKRTREYLAQEARRDGGRLLPPASIQRIRKAASLTDIVKEIGAHRRRSAT
jgi:hypothetical protein